MLPTWLPQQKMAPEQVKKEAGSGGGGCGCSPHSRFGGGGAVRASSYMFYVNGEKHYHNSGKYSCAPIIISGRRVRRRQIISVVLIIGLTNSGRAKLALSANILLIFAGSARRNISRFKNELTPNDFTARARTKAAERAGEKLAQALSLSV